MTNPSFVAAALLSLSCFSLMSPAAAQVVTNADSSAGQPTVDRDERGFRSCGVRMVVQVQQQRYAEVYDFSINLNAEMYRGLLKAGRYTVPGSEAKGWDILKKKVAVPGPLYYWFAAQTEGVPLKPEKYSPGHDDGFILSVADFSKTAELIYAINAGERMQFALKYKGDKLDRVVAFKPDLAADDRQAIKACLLGMSERIEAELQEATPAK